MKELFQKYIDLKNNLFTPNFSVRYDMLQVEKMNIEDIWLEIKNIKL